MPARTLSLWATVRVCLPIPIATAFLISEFPRVLKSPEFRVFKIQDFKSPEIGQWS